MTLLNTTENKYLLIKVCGMKYSENIRQTDLLKPDIMGFIFYEKSQRYVESVPEYLPVYCKRAGVFVDQNMDFILSKANEYKLNIIQLHGSESPDICNELTQKGFDVIKVFHIPVESTSLSDEKSSYINSITAPYEGKCNYFLFDTSCREYGGSGKAFDWNIIKSYSGKTPFLLSGGISPEKLEELECFNHENWAGIDINSRFETSPGLKNIKLLKQFITDFRKTDV